MAPKRRVVAGTLTAIAGFAVLGVTPALAATSYPDDYFFAAGDQWALTGAMASIKAPAAWCISTGLSKVVGMVDTGADFGHPELQGKLRSGVAYTGGTATTESQTSSTSLQDVEGHGTVTTGTVVANTNNNEGIAAVAPDAQALVMQVRGTDGSIWESDIALAIEYAADHGANVINVSIEPGQIQAGSTNVPDLTIPFAAQYASQKNAAVVLAAGNDNSSQAVYPNLSGIALVVGALSPSGTMASYSNHGSDVSIYAPGGDAPKDASGNPQMTLQNSIVSTDTRSTGYSYAMAEGTSLSAPMVSGTIALLMAHGDTAKQAISAITSSAVHRNGLPELDAAAALNAAGPCGSPPATMSSAPPPPLGHTVDPTPSPTHSATPRPQTTHTATSTVTTSSAAQTQTTSTLTSSDSSSSASGGAAQAGGNDVGQGGRGRGLPPAHASPGGGGGVPVPLVLGGLGLLVAGGAPLGLRLARVWRGRGLMR